jgi:hypothetical protein
VTDLQKLHYRSSIYGQHDQLRCLWRRYSTSSTRST